MTIQSCPVEVLDKIFESTAYSDPENAQATLYSLMLTCSHFRTIAKRHFIRIVCLPSAEMVNSFASYLKNVVKSGEYGKGVLPIQHLAVAGNYRIPQGLSFRNRSDAEVEAERIVPFIITTAAPSLLTLTIVGVDSDFLDVDPQEIPYVPNGTTFPNLRDLIALEQHVVPLLYGIPDTRASQLTVSLLYGIPDTQASQLTYPSLRRLYISGDPRISLHSTLPYLEDLRLDMLDQELLGSLPGELEHVRSLIIDAPGYYSFIFIGCIGLPQSRDEYTSKISKYQTLIDKVGNPERNGIVIPVDGFTNYINRVRILSAWADAVVGGVGCWSPEWVPTILWSGRHEE